MIIPSSGSTVHNLVDYFFPSSTDGANGRQKMVSQHEILQLILCIGFHLIGFLAMYVPIKFPSPFLS